VVVAAVETRLARPGDWFGQLSVSTSARAEVLAPVPVSCNGDVFKAPVQLDTEGVYFTMNPVSGSEGRYAFKLVPSME